MSRSTRSWFAALVHAHHAAVYSAARRIVRSDADAEDVTQQVYLRALEQTKTLALAREPRALLVTMARHLACNALRDSARRTTRERRSAMSETEPDPSRAASAAEEHALLRQHLAELPDELRVPLVLRFAENLPFAAVGEALAMAESTACERVHRGLARLREVLLRAGLAGVAPRIEVLLAEPLPCTVPAGLEPALLALCPAPALLGGMAQAVGALAVLGLGSWGLATALDPAAEPPLLVAGAFAAEGHASTGPAPVAAESQDPSGGRRPMPQATPASRPETQGPATRLQAAHLEGRVRESHGGPLTGWLVVATSEEYRGKEPLFRVESTTDFGGGFFLDLPVVDPGGNAYRLVVRKPGEAIQPVYRHPEPLLAKPGARLDFLDLPLGGDHVPRTGDHRLRVTVLDPDGAPVAGATLTLHPRSLPVQIADRYTPVASGTADGSGQALLRCRRLGNLTLRIDARRAGFALHLEELTVAQPGERDLTARLARGIALEGRIRTVDGAPVGTHVGVRVVDETAGEDHDAHGEVAADGTFRIAGLANRPHRLDVVAHGYSPVRRRGIVPGGAALHLTLKRFDDPRDVGDHWGEIHGVVRAAGSQQEVVVSVWDVDAHWLGRLEPPDLRRDFVPDLVHGRSVQKAIAGPEPEPSSRFHCTDLGPGRWLLEVRAKGYAPAFVGPLELAPGQLRNEVVVELRAGATVRGTVCDPAGAPVAGAVVFLAGQGVRAERKVADQDQAVATSQGRTTIHLDGETRTDAQGRFVLERVPPDLPLRVLAVHPRWRPADAAPRSFADGERAEGVALRFTTTR